METHKRGKVKITEISGFPDKHKLLVTVAQEKTETIVEFTIINEDGTINCTGEELYARLCRAALNDQTISSCDANELIGRYVMAEIEDGSNKSFSISTGSWLPCKKEGNIKDPKQLLAELKRKKIVKRN